MLLVAFLLGWLFGYLWHNGDISQTDTNKRPERFAGTSKDDLKIVEGIGPKIESLLKEAGIKTMVQLAQADTAKLKKVLTNGGDRFQMHDPSSWADQASLATEEKWAALAKYQDLLVGGRTN
jgi:predicted flap endonuclease-1-like 5' DNA nuclease